LLVTYHPIKLLSFGLITLLNWCLLDL
jgi:hypothetical protein